MKKLLSTIALAGALIGTARAQSTNEVEQTTDPSNMVVHVTNAVDTVAKTTTNAVEQAVAYTTNAINQVVSPTNEVAQTATSTNTVSATKADAQVTDTERAIVKEAIEQIPADVTAITNGLSEVQLIALAAGLHMEPRNGTHDIMVDYWKAAGAGLDVRQLEQDYIKRNKEQSDYMRTCQESAANARLNGQKDFTVSGVSFDLESPQLALNLVRLYSAKTAGHMSIIVDGRPFSIVRTPAEEKMFRKVFDRDIQQFRLVPKYRPRATFPLPEWYQKAM